MEIQYSELSNQINLIKLIGKLDIIGVNEIDIKFTGYCAGENARVLVDLSQVDFLASIGIRLLVTNAKSLLMRAGKMVLLNPNPDVKNVLEMTGISDITPIYENFEYSGDSSLTKENIEKNLKEKYYGFGFYSGMYFGIAPSIKTLCPKIKKAFLHLAEFNGAKVIKDIFDN